MNFEDLEIWKISDEAVILIHDMTIRDLPKFEMFETGSQIRRSVKSTKSNIVEGFGRRSFKKDFLRYLIIAQASNDETIDHLQTLFKTKSLTNTVRYSECLVKLRLLGKKLNCFIQAVQKNNLPESLNR